MGSLMAGWDSHTLDPKSALLKRNKSLTKEEIVSYWKLKKDIEEQHLKAISDVSDSIQESKYEDSNKRFQTSNTLPLYHSKENFLKAIAETNLEDPRKKNAWWTKSNWAFLNEPPVTEMATNNYVSQFHVANLPPSKLNSTGGGVSP